LGILRITPYPVVHPDKVCPLTANRSGATASGADTSMRRDGLDLGFQRASLLIHGDGVIQNGATINAFPRMKDEEEV